MTSIYSVSLTMKEMKKKAKKYHRLPQYTRRSTHRFRRRSRKTKTYDNSWRTPYRLATPTLVTTTIRIIYASQRLHPAGYIVDMNRRRLSTI